MCAHFYVLALQLFIATLLEDWQRPPQMPLNSLSSLATVVDSHADADRLPAEGPIALSPLPPEAS